MIGVMTLLTGYAKLSDAEEDDKIRSYSDLFRKLAALPIPNRKAAIMDLIETEEVSNHIQAMYGL